MSAISDYKVKADAHNARQGAAIDSLVLSVGGLTEDIAALNAKILELQNSQGQVTPEDQLLIDDLVLQGDALATKVEGVASAMKTLDEQTPPPIPVA